MFPEGSFPRRCRRNNVNTVLPALSTTWWNDMREKRNPEKLESCGNADRYIFIRRSSKTALCHLGDWKTAACSWIKLVRGEKTANWTVKIVLSSGSEVVPATTVTTSKHVSTGWTQGLVDLESRPGKLVIRGTDPNQLPWILWGGNSSCCPTCHPDLNYHCWALKSCLYCQSLISR